MKRVMLLLAALGMMMLAASPAMAQSGADGGFNCIDFPDQESAQLFFESDPSDPEGLDADDDGLACEDELPSSGVDPLEGTESFIVTTARTSNTCPEPFVSNFDPNDPATAETFTCIAPGDLEAATPEVAPSEVVTEAPAASETMTALPDTGGVSLIALGAGALLVAGGLLIRRK